MEKKEGKGRQIITNVLTESMMRELRSIGGVIVVHAVGEGVEELRGRKLLSALKDEALVKALNERGIDVSVNPIKVTLLPGDTLFVINPGVKMHELPRDAEIPEYSTITLTQYDIFTQKDYMRMMQDTEEE